MAAARGGALTTLQPNTASINRNKHAFNYYNMKVPILFGQSAL